MGRGGGDSAEVPGHFISVLTPGERFKGEALSCGLKIISESANGSSESGGMAQIAGWLQSQCVEIGSAGQGLSCGSAPTVQG